MPFGRYVLIEPTLPTDPQERIRALFGIHTQLTTMYGERYREIDSIVTLTREWSEAMPLAGEPPAEQRPEILAQVLQVRTDTVLFFKMMLARAELLINELVPGTFPVTDDPPLESIDPDEVFQLGAGIVALGGAITAAGGAVVGAPVAAFGAGMMIGAAISGMLWD